MKGLETHYLQATNVRVKVGNKDVVRSALSSSTFNKTLNKILQHF